MSRGGEPLDRDPAVSWPAIRYALLALAAGALFLPWIDGYFLADDWMILGRNLDVAWSEVPRWFLFVVRHDWYRPLYELLAMASWHGFGLSTTGYHLVQLGLYVAVVAMVGWLGERLAEDWRVGLVATAIFAVQGFHSEPVLWFAAASELLLAIAALFGLAGYISFRRTGRRRWLAAAALGYALALMSKETAVTLPLAWLAYEGLYGADAPSVRSRRRWWPVAVALAAGALFFIWRVEVGNPYPIKPTPSGLVRNVGHYVTLEVLATPIDFDYTARLSPWQPSRLLPISSTLLATAALAVVVVLWVRWGRWREQAATRRTVLFAATFAAVALAPVLPIVTERTAFLSSVGVAWALAGLFVGLLEVAQRHTAGAADVVAVALALYLAANASGLVYRCMWWGRAAETSRSVIGQLETQLAELPPEADVWLVGVPDHRAYAYIFRNAFPWARDVMGLRQSIRVVLDTELPAAADGRMLRPQPGEWSSWLGVSPGAVVLWYGGGTLTRMQ